MQLYGKLDKNVSLFFSLYGSNKEMSKRDLSADEKVKRAFYLAQRNADQVNKHIHIFLTEKKPSMKSKTRGVT